MNQRHPLRGIRVHLAGSVPDNATPEQRTGIQKFARELTSGVLSAGGTLIHGSHPTLTDSLIDAARPFVAADGPRDSLTLVRSERYAITPDQKSEIAEHRKVSVVQIIPSKADNRSESLLSMREWMAERSDVVVAVGGKWYEQNPAAAGVVTELETALERGHPGFALGGFGGAVRSYLNEDHCDVLPRLRNGMSREKNEELSNSSDPAELAHDIIRQIKRLPLVRGSVSSGRPFRILALDGGGIRGAFTAAVLARWAEMLETDGGHQLIKHFDLIAGTSTGAILAIGLATGLTPAAILKFYREKGPTIFSGGNWTGSKYDSKTLKTTLQEILGDKRVSDASCRLVIPTVRANDGTAELIVTAHSPDRTAYRDLPVVDAAMASAAAPTYFDQHTIADDITARPFLDGGIWANNPVLAAIAEAVGPLGWPLDRIDVLSVGTLHSESDFSSRLGGGNLKWATGIAELFFAAQSSAATLIANQLVSRARHLRVNQQTPFEIKLDAVNAIDKLSERGSNVAIDTFDIVRSRFLDGLHAPPWDQPLPSE